VLVPRYKLSLCHTPIKLDLLGFLGISVFACGLRDHMITRFASSCHILLQKRSFSNKKSTSQKKINNKIHIAYFDLYRKPLMIFDSSENFPQRRQIPLELYGKVSAQSNS
jgi:hypothetical protein